MNLLDFVMMITNKHTLVLFDTLINAISSSYNAYKEQLFFFDSGAPTAFSKQRAR